MSLEEVTSAARSKELEIKESKDYNSDSLQRNGEGYFACGRSDKRDKPSISGRKDKGRSRSGSGCRLKCWFCNKEGHMRKDFYARRKKYDDDERGEADVVVDQNDDALSVSDNRHGDE